MCGIAGIIRTKSSNAKNSISELLQKATQALQHRGPDNSGIFITANELVGLAHTRLSIIDLSVKGNQPMHSSCGNYYIVHNGEIYNYKALKQQLESKGFVFHSNTDTEVLLAMYQAYGEAMLPMLDGMFAFAIWNQKENSLFLARDRFGEKPLYLHANENEILFASEIKTFWALGVEQRPFMPMFALFLGIGFTNIPTEPQASFYEGIHMLPHAGSATINADTLDITINRYWDLDKSKQINISENDAIQQFEILLNQSVKTRLQADVAIGLSLSGGLDSSSIAAFIKKQTSGELNSFSAIYDGFEKDEANAIQQINEHLQLKPHYTKPNADEFANDFGKLIQVQEQPFASSSAYAQFKVYEQAKKHNTIVLLDGQGADETLAGYKKYLHWFLQELYKYDKKNFASAKNAILTNHKEVSWSWRNKLAAYLPLYTTSRLEKRASNTVKWHSHLTEDFLNKSYNRLLIQKPIVQYLNDILYYNTMQHGLQELLRYADKNSMAHSVEVRLPFLQHELVEFVYSLPSSYKIANGYTKYILRKTVSNMLPDSVVWNYHKIGFETPEKTWLQHEFFKDKLTNAIMHLQKMDILDKSINKEKLSTEGRWRIIIAAEYL